MVSDWQAGFFSTAKCARAACLVTLGLGFFVVMASSAHAESCQQVIDTYNNNSHQNNAAYAAKFYQAFGHGPGDMRSPAECPQLIQIQRWYIGVSQLQVLLYRRAEKLCNGVHSTPGQLAPGLTSANKTPEQAIASSQRIIALCQSARQ
jgi:hypothetical protein